MGAALKKHERERMVRMTARLRKPLSWRERILRELRRGPATTTELWACIGIDPKRKAPSVAYAALNALLAEGAIIERPELQPARRVRVEPVMVLEVVR